MKKSIIIYLHLLFWGILLSTFYFLPTISYWLDATSERFIDLGNWWTLLAFFYFGYLGIMKTKAKFRFYIISLITTIGIYPLMYFLSTLSSENLSLFKRIFWFMSVSEFHPILWLTLGCLFGFFVDWYNKRNDIKALERENITSNLAMLKFQINPHFLFNTLHNIDTLIHENQDNASKSLIKLSDIMRYMLHDAKSELVELEKEVEHLQNYLSLEQLRLKNEKFLNYSINGNAKGINIAPMIMIPFVENAFKHSVDSDIENGITININIENNTLNFKCENCFDTSDTDKDNTHGIGLNTVKKRLNLIYKDRYNLSIRSDNSIFKVDLKIELHEN